MSRSPLPPAARTGAGILCGLALLAAAAPLLAPHDPAEQLDAAESSRRPPLSSLLVVRTLGAEPLLAERVTVDDADLVLERRSGSLRVPFGSVTNHREEGIAERRRNWLGTDALGRDVLSRLLHGSRVSLTIGLLAAGLALTAGTLVGSCAAVGGRFVDQTLMRTVDGLLCFPHLALVLLLAALYRPDTTLLVLLIGGEVRLGYGDVARLLDGYEGGARVVIGDRRALAGRALRPLVGLAFGIRRNDMGSPVRLYDAEALQEVIDHVPPASSHPTLLMSMVEHRLRFSVKEIRLRNAAETPREEDPVTALAETLTGLTELLSFRAAARAIR